MPAAPIPFDEARRLEALARSCLLNTAADPAFDRITALAAEVFEVPIALITLVAEQRQWFKSKVGTELQETPREQAFCAYAILSDGPMVVLDARKDERFADNPLVTGPTQIAFYAGIPLRTRDGHAVGTLCLLDHKARASFTQREHGMLIRMADMLIGRLETLRTIGHIDHLTQLPNRARALEVLRELLAAAPSAQAHPILAAKIDCGGYLQFAEMAGALGHEHADAFLLQAKDRLLGLLPKSTTLYRAEHTRFLVFLHDIDDAAAADLFTRISAAFDRPVLHNQIACDSQTTIAAMRLGDCREPGEVVRGLMSTLESLRRSGDKWGFYEPRSDEASVRHFKILSSVSTALHASNQLSLHYQPRIDLRTGACTGAEALLRWHHPQLGSLSPGEFIPLLEKTALMEQVTRWVLNEGIRQAAKWQSAGHQLRISLNVSATDLDRRDFVDQLCGILDTSRVDASLIELEFTESALTLQPERLSRHLTRVKQLGLSLAIDDFGTGYSNLSYLKRIPATSLKLDQSFIRALMTDERDRAIVPSILELAHALGFSVVAEGIESEDVLEQLSQWGCNEGQGFGIARPMPVSQFEEWLATSGVPGGLNETRLQRR